MATGNRGGGSPRKPEQAAAMVRMRTQERMSYRAIARCLGVHHSRVHYVVKRELAAREAAFLRRQLRIPLSDREDAAVNQAAA